VSAPNRIFISHAGADWESVVQPVASGLQATNHTVVTEDWDNRQGESLVQRILEEELPVSQTAVIVLSRSSVDKPWVREEFDHATVTHISRKIRVILLHIDECQVPVPLQTLRKITVRTAPEPDNRIREAIDEIGVRVRHPPLSAPSSQTDDRPPRGLKPLDWRVLTVLGDLAWNQQGDWITVKDVYQQASDMGLADEQATKILDRLVSRGFAQGKKYTFGQHYASLKMTVPGAGAYCRAVYPELDSWRTQLAAQIASHDADGPIDLKPENDFPSLVFRTAIDELLTMKLIRGYWFPGANLVRILERSPTLRKWLDRQ
jgi:hypothetical protein